jgi:hypothetical protein
VPSNFTLERLHHILQFVMGWTNSHPHEFQAGDVRYGPPNPEDWDADGIVSEERTRLGQVLGAPKDRLLYTYDFGDDWQHDIVLEKVLAREPGMKLSFPKTHTRRFSEAFRRLAVAGSEPELI